jgi:mevalonate kinase
VPCAIERRARVSAERRDDDRVRVSADDLTLNGFTVAWGGEAGEAPELDVPANLVDAAMGYLDGAVEQARDAAREAGADDPDAGLDLSVESSIPLGAGLGSSAAVVVAAIDAAARELGATIDRAELADRAFQVEHEVQDGQASRADTYCSTMGGAVRVQGDDCRRLDGVDQLPFVVGYDGGAGDTGELVAGVRELRDQHPFAADTVGAIGDLVREGERLLRGDQPLAELGELMDFNHGLLSALGVSARSLDAMVWAARESGAYGAKLTGAGGGGCVVVLDDTEGAKTALDYTPGCEEVFRAELDTDGVRRES